MSTLELEANKAEMAREILGETDNDRLNEWVAFTNDGDAIYPQITQIYTEKNELNS
jgi:hypothetical protein